MNNRLTRYATAQQPARGDRIEGLFSGKTGRVIKVMPGSKALKVKFDNGICTQVQAHGYNLVARA